jgi:hypothetical protein
MEALTEGKALFLWASFTKEIPPNCFVIEMNFALVLCGSKHHSARARPQISFPNRNKPPGSLLPVIGLVKKLLRIFFRARRIKDQCQSG